MVSGHAVYDIVEQLKMFCDKDKKAMSLDKISELCKTKAKDLDIRFLLDKIKKGFRGVKLQMAVNLRLKELEEKESKAYEPLVVFDSLCEALGLYQTR